MSSEEPTQREKKYDRQIRLWGMNGQKALESCKICVLNASATGTETLKNLVLPGIGSFTIVDGNVVTEDDLGSNFFVTVDDLGQPRGERTAKWLLELNPDVKGCSLNEYPAKVIEANPGYFSDNDFSLVIASELRESTALKLANILNAVGIPLLLARSYGLMGFVRVDIGQRATIETFPDQAVEDYRILQPFPELEEFAQCIGDPSAVEDTMLHGHIPWVCLLLHYTKKWKAAKGWTGESLTYAERKEILAMVNEGKKGDGEENFAEAAVAGHKINPPSLPSEIKELLNRPDTDELTEKSDPFWFCMNALKKFYDCHKVLPINGKLADMTSTTQWFIGLQTVFANKAQKDLEEIQGHIQESLTRLQAEGKKGPEIPLEYIQMFCKNVWHVRYMNGRPLSLEYSPSTANVSAFPKDFNAEESNAVWYLLLRAGDRFFEGNERFPGENGVLDEDIPHLDKCLKGLIADLGIPNTVDTEFVQEWVRYGASQLHNISAVLGGIASQEAIKIITNQRVTINNTLVYNGINCTMSTYEF